MSESNLWGRVREAFVLAGHMQRIESGGTAMGIPDVNYCFDGKEGWIELKHGVWPKKGSTHCFASQRGLTPEQVEWLSFRAQCGGRVWILLQVSFDVLLIPGKCAALVNGSTMAQMLELAVVRTKMPMKKEDWQKIKEKLVE